jgi:ParB family chromosome partitioning protein
MTENICPIPLSKLIAHPDNPNKMSQQLLKKLIENIQTTGLYEPLIVRKHPQKNQCFQLINGHHRKKALKKLGFETANCIVWNIDDEQTDIFLLTLNRLAGSDSLSSKLKLLKRLNNKLDTKHLSKLLPQTKTQLDKLFTLKLPEKPIPITEDFAQTLVFFVRAKQKEIIENALSAAAEKETADMTSKEQSEALVKIAQTYLQTS